MNERMEKKGDWGVWENESEWIKEKRKDIDNKAKKNVVVWNVNVRERVSEKVDNCSLNNIRKRLQMKEIQFFISTLSDVCWKRIFWDLAISSNRS